MVFSSVILAFNSSLFVNSLTFLVLLPFYDGDHLRPELACSQLISVTGSPWHSSLELSNRLFTKDLVRALHCKPPNMGFESTWGTYVCGVFSIEWLLGHVYQLWPVMSKLLTHSLKAVCINQSINQNILWHIELPV